MDPPRNTKDPTRTIMVPPKETKDPRKEIRDPPRKTVNPPSETRDQGKLRIHQVKLGIHHGTADIEDER